MSRAVGNKTGTNVTQGSTVDLQHAEVRFDPSIAKPESPDKVKQKSAPGVNQKSKSSKNRQQNPQNKKHTEVHRHGDPESEFEENQNFRNATRNGQVQNKTNKKGTVAVAEEEQSVFIDPNMDLTSALELRAKAAASMAERIEGEEPDVILDGVYQENEFATSMRSASSFSAFDDSPQLQVMLGEIIDLSEYFEDRAQRGEPVGLDQNEVAQIFNLANMKKKRARGAATEEDIDSMLLVQYLPIIYDAITRIIQKGLDEESIAKMESLKGEIAQLVRSASDPESPLHEMFKNVKVSLEDREMVEFEAA